MAAAVSESSRGAEQQRMLARDREKQPLERGQKVGTTAQGYVAELQNQRNRNLPGSAAGSFKEPGFQSVVDELEKEASFYEEISGHLSSALSFFPCEDKPESNAVDMSLFSRLLRVVERIRSANEVLSRINDRING